MNSITRLILRRVVSGNIKLTPRLLQVLKEFDAEPPSPEPPVQAANETAPPPPPPAADNTSAEEKKMTFVNQLPGRWIRRTECGLGAVLLLAASLAPAALNPAPLAAANEAFAQGEYAAAARGYEAILAQQGYSAPVLFNLANAQQRAGQLGPAILNYERARLLDPNDADLATNLNTARRKAGVETERPSPAQTAAQALTLSHWFALAAAATFLIAVALPLRHLIPRARSGLNFGSVLAAFALVMAVAALGLRRSDLTRAVVTAPEAVAGIAPVTMAQSLFKLRAGETVTLQQTHGAFARVRNQAGQLGWVKTDQIARVIPARATFPGS